MTCRRRGMYTAVGETTFDPERAAQGRAQMEEFFQLGRNSQVTGAR
jgi:hypothetical protein